MTTDNESVRKEFEDKFPVPEGIIEWNTATSRYVHPTHRISMVADQYNQLLSVWQASRERYEPHQIAEETIAVNRLALEAIIESMRFCAAPYRSFDAEQLQNLIATPNGGNEE